MTDFDFDRLGDVWREHPTPEEMAELKRSADAVARRALWGQRLDLVSALVVSAVVLFLILASGKTDTIVIGGLVILILLFSQIRSRRLREAELRALTGTTEDMLDQSIARVQATAKRTRSQMLLLIPGFGLGLLVASRVGDGVGFLSRLLSGGTDRALVLVMAFIMVTATAWIMWNGRRQAQLEESRLVRLRQDYRRELEQSDADRAS